MQVLLGIHAKVIAGLEANYRLLIESALDEAREPADCVRGLSVTSRMQLNRAECTRI